MKLKIVGCFSGMQSCKLIMPDGGLFVTYNNFEVLLYCCLNITNFLSFKKIPIILLIFLQKICDLICLMQVPITAHVSQQVEKGGFTTAKTDETR